MAATSAMSAAAESMATPRLFWNSALALSSSVPATRTVPMGFIGMCTRPNSSNVAAAAVSAPYRTITLSAPSSGTRSSARGASMPRSAHTSASGSSSTNQA